MPTGTSTIFGVFQAMLALLVKPDELRPTRKVMRNENFASESFVINPYIFAAAQKDFTTLSDPASKQCGINVFRVTAVNGMLAPVRTGAAKAGWRTREMPPLPAASRRRKWVLGSGF
jgi:hypothetical protein